MEEEKKKSRVMVFGATGRIGQELVKASLVAGHPTLAVARESAFSVPYKSSLLSFFADSGVTILNVSLSDYASLLGAVKQADIVISALPAAQCLEQKILIHAIKEAGCVRRFIPSEFGADPDKVQILDMDMDFYKKKAEIRRLIESEGIPHTYVSCNFFMTYLLPSLVQTGSMVPPRDRLKIYGDGNSKAVFVKESDVAAFTIASIDDPRTLNKVLYLRPPGNVVSMNDLVELWEMKIAKNLEKDYVPEEVLLKNIQDIPFPGNKDLIFIYSAFIKGDHTYFNIDEAGVDATRLYSNVRHTTDMLDWEFSEKGIGKEEVCSYFKGHSLCSNSYCLTRRRMLIRIFFVNYMIVCISQELNFLLVLHHHLLLACGEKENWK